MTSLAHAPADAATAAGPATGSSAPAWHVESLLRLADAALVHSQRLSEWCGHGPILEEDLALTNVALDLLGQARLLYAHAGALEGRGRDEDAFAYWRDAGAFRNPTLVELPNGTGPRDDYAVTIARLFLHAAWQVPAWSALAGSADAQLAAIAAKSVKESRYHLEHARQWMVRFGDGTAESNRRAQAALDRLWPYTREWFVDDPIDAAAAQAGVGVLPSSLRPAWDGIVDTTLAEATLRRPADSEFVSTGRQGVHSEYLGHLLAEMQTLARAHPGARW